MHGDLQAAAIDIHLQVVVIHFLTLERVVLSAFNRISVRSRTTGHEIYYATMFMAFIVMHMGGENDNSGAEVLLPRLQRLGQLRS